MARGTLRLFATMGLAGATEVRLGNGRRVDVMGVDDRGRISVAEVKCSVADFRSDEKWPEYKDFCDFLYFSVPLEFPADLVPEDCGLIVADRFGGEVIRSAPAHGGPAASRRKAVLVRFARTVARRLRRLEDPEG